MRCELCKHAGPPIVGVTEMECYRYPPAPVMVLIPDKATGQMTQRVISFFPKVDRSQKCGEWASRIGE